MRAPATRAPCTARPPASRAAIGPPTRRAVWLVAAALACGPRQPPQLPDPEVHVAGDPPADDLLARLRTHAAAGGLLYWRLGARCEPWRLAPTDGDPDQGRLLLAAPSADVEAPPVPADSDTSPPGHVPTDTTDAPADLPEEHVPSDSPTDPPPAALWFSYRVVDGHLTLTAPEHERPVPAVPGSSHAIGTALACVYAGLALTTAGPDGPSRQLVLDARERFFLDAASCAAAGPADDPPGPAELRPLGCASALADPATRARLAGPPAPGDAIDPAPHLRRHRRIFLLRRGPDGARCEAWRHRVRDGEPRHGLLHRDDRDDRGAFTRYYAYEAAPGLVTLQGPTEVWRPRVAGRRAEAMRARGCLVTRPVTAVTADALLVGDDPWFLSRRACEAARTAGAAPPPPLPCL